MALVEIKLKLDASQFKNQAGQVQDITVKGSASFQSFAAKATAVSLAFNQVTDAIRKVASVIAVPLRAFSELETSMANVASLGVDNIGQLTDEVLELGNQISVPIESLTAGLFEVVSAGVDANHQIEVLNLSAQAAKAGVTDTTQALKLASAVVKGYGLEWDATEGILDRAFQTNKLGQTTFPELAANIGQVVPLASALKVSVDELFGSFATLTGVTGNTSEVATQLKAIMQGLANPTKELSRLIEEQTGQTVEQMTVSEGLAGILQIVGEATGGSAAKMTELFGSVEAVNAVLALSGTQLETFNEKTNAMTESAGAMTGAFEIQNDTIESQVQLLENRWNSIMVKAVEIAVPFANSLLDIGQKALDTRSQITKLTESIEDVKKEMGRLDDLDGLIKRYEVLQEKTELSKDEHDELKGIIETLGALYPTAINQVDQYGKAVGISAAKVKFLVEQRRALLRAQENELLEASKGELAKQLDLIINRQSKLNEIQESGVKRMGRFVVEQTDVSEAVESFNKRLAENSDELNESLSLLSNFFDFEADKGKLTAQLGLTEQQVSLLIERWQELNQVVVKVATEEPSAAIVTPTVVSEQAGGLFDEPVAIPVKPVISEVPDIGAPALDVSSFQEIMDHEIRMVELRNEAMLISDEDYFERKRALLQASLENFEATLGAESEKALEVRTELIALEQEKAEQEIALRQQVIDATIGGFSVLLQSAQGVSTELFAVGKAAAIAEAVVNTYAAANKALAALPPPFSFIAAAATIVQGLLNVKQIAATKFQAKADGGFLGSEIRTVAAGNFGGGENRLIIANAGEFIINAKATAQNRAILEAINAGSNFTPVRFQSGGAVGAASAESLQNLRLDFDRFAERVVTAIGRVNINLVGTLDGQDFLRDNFQEFEQREAERRF